MNNGPYFFLNEEGDNVTATGVRYCQMLEDFDRPSIQNKSPIRFQQYGATDETPIWFQQDGTKVHMARETLNLLQDMFSTRIIVCD